MTEPHLTPADHHHYSSHSPRVLRIAKQFLVRAIQAGLLPHNREADRQLAALDYYIATYDMRIHADQLLADLIASRHVD